ncbi:MAG: hypothetical protein [Wendovervirus sonii]|uniref:S1 motif domain-containing protein n=1 Tax=phage Lak_Megaphage_Sonny TaxID=3109229 RepID=A0ABZ0Z681_9CAUD|nr:MAG: hypothetical protein [phage Lak_Megaphage_Sonny]
MNNLNTMVEGVPGFDWDLYENDGKIQTANDADYKKYSRKEYLDTWTSAYKSKKIPATKELKKDTLVNITGIDYIDENVLLASINGGVNNVVIDLNKEQKFFNIISTENGERLDKDTFVKYVKNPEFASKIIDLGLYAKIGTDSEKGSIWGGYVENMATELKSQIKKKNKAYMATILSTNNGGYIVEVADTIQAFMPGSMAAANKITNYEELVGKSMEVMVESYDKKLGFVVSRKKYLHTIFPAHLLQLQQNLADNKDYMITGTITGTKQFGIYVELDEVLTGMIHKTLMDDETRELLRQNKIEAGTKINVYVHKIDKDNRIILSTVPSDQQPEIIKKREAEDLAEKVVYMNAKKEEALKVEASNDTEQTAE